MNRLLAPYFACIIDNGAWPCQSSHRQVNVKAHCILGQCKATRNKSLDMYYYCCLCCPLALSPCSVRGTSTRGFPGGEATLLPASSTCIDCTNGALPKSGRESGGARKWPRSMSIVRLKMTTAGLCIVSLQNDHYWIMYRLATK